MIVWIKENGPTLFVQQHDSSLVLQHDSSLEKFSVLFVLYRNSLCQSLRGWIRWRTHASAMTNTDSVFPACSELCGWRCAEGSGLDIAGYERRLSIPIHPNTECWKSSCWMNSVTEKSPTSPHQRDWGKAWVSSIHMYFCIMISWQIYPSLPRESRCHEAQESCRPLSMTHTPGALNCSDCWD